MVSKFIRGAVLAGAVTASIAATGSVAEAAAPAANNTTVHAQAKSQVYIVCDGLEAVYGCQYPIGINYPFAGQFYTGGPYFAYDQPWFGDWWGDNGWGYHSRYPHWRGWDRWGRGGGWDRGWGRGGGWGRGWDRGRGGRWDGRANFTRRGTNPPGDTTI